MTQPRPFLRNIRQILITRGVVVRQRRTSRKTGSTHCAARPPGPARSPACRRTYCSWPPMACAMPLKEQPRIQCAGPPAPAREGAAGADFVYSTTRRAALLMSAHRMHGADDAKRWQAKEGPKSSGKGSAGGCAALFRRLTNDARRPRPQTTLRWPSMAGRPLRPPRPGAPSARATRPDRSPSTAVAARGSPSRPRRRCAISASGLLRRCSADVTGDRPGTPGARTPKPTEAEGSEGRRGGRAGQGSRAESGAESGERGRLLACSTPPQSQPRRPPHTPHEAARDVARTTKGGGGRQCGGASG